MMVHFRKRFSEEDLKRINELIAERDKAMVIEAMSSLPDVSDDPGADAVNHISLDDLVKPAYIAYSNDLKLLNEARESIKRIINNLCEQP